MANTIRRVYENGILEAVCEKCGHIFNPADEDDLIHIDCTFGVERNYFSTGDIQTLYLLVNGTALLIYPRYRYVAI